MVCYVAREAKLTAKVKVENQHVKEQKVNLIASPPSAAKVIGKTKCEKKRKRRRKKFIFYSYFTLHFVIDRLTVYHVTLSEYLSFSYLQCNTLSESTINPSKFSRLFFTLNLLTLFDYLLSKIAMI